MKLNEYEQWIDNVRNYWYNIIDNSSCTDVEKTNFKNIVDSKLQEFLQAVNEYKQRFPKLLFKRLIMVYKSIYNFNECSNLYDKYSQLPRANLEPITKHTFYYTYELTDNYDVLFSLSVDTNCNFTTEGMDNVISDVQSLDDSIEFKSLFDYISDILTDIGVSFMLNPRLKFEYNKIPKISIAEYTGYKQICKDFDIHIYYDSN